MGITHERRKLAFAMSALWLSSLWLLADGRKGSSGASEKEIFDLLPQREPATTFDERQKMQKELNAARNRQINQPSWGSTWLMRNRVGLPPRMPAWK
jgi:hypothetical protein